MKERPILFSAPMVRAIMDGRKTQTRRIVKNIGVAPGIGEVLKGSDDASEWPDYCPHGKVGDRLWVRETWSKAKHSCSSELFYRADGECNGKQTALSFIERESRWRPSIHMPRLASRILLEITNVRIERLNDISEEDALAEGCFKFTFEDDHAYTFYPDYRKLWESINGKGSWDLNPWVWVINFKRIG